MCKLENLKVARNDSRCLIAQLQDAYRQASPAESILIRQLIDRSKSIESDLNELVLAMEKEAHKNND